MLTERTNVFVLENEKPAENNPDVNPYRCSYCGILAIIERETLPEAMDSVPMAQAVYCNCEDATTEKTLKQEVSDLSGVLASKNQLLKKHMETKVFDSDTRIMRYEDAVLTLQKQFGIEV